MVRVILQRSARTGSASSLDPGKIPKKVDVSVRIFVRGKVGLSFFDRWVSFRRNKPHKSKANDKIVDSFDIR